MSDHLNSTDTEPSERDFFRVFALGCFDAFITQAISITIMVKNTAVDGPYLTFYQGWSFIHSDWEPASIPKSMWSTSKGAASAVYWDKWVNLVYALVFFALFGLTSDARKGYHRFYRFLGRPFGIGQAESMEDELPGAVFKSGRGTNATATSNISSRCVRIPRPANYF